MITLDSTQISTVVLCSHCPWWHGFADSRDEGWTVGARHEQNLHPELDQARNTRDKRASRARHAVSTLSGVRSAADGIKRESVEAQHPEPSARRDRAGHVARDQEPRGLGR